MKITVIGGGSTYTPELVQGFLNKIDILPLTELWLMDNDPQRLEIVGGFARRMVHAAGDPFKVILSESQREAVAGAGYVITQIRVGKMAARRSDEYLGFCHGLVGQETTGVGGMAKALRTIPVILSIANDVRETAPDALLLNFTNPSGLITEALQRYAPDVQSVGVCNVGITTKMEIMKKMEAATGNEIDPAHAYLDTLGLNHLTWHRGFIVNGSDVWGNIFPAYVNEIRQQTEPEWDVNMLEALGMIPNYYLHYYYATRKKILDQQQWPPSRAEEVMAIEASLLQQFVDPQLITPPADLMKRGGAWYSTLATEVIASHYADLGQIHVINTRHHGAVQGWPEDWVLEMPASVDRQGIHPLKANSLPEAPFALIAAVKMYELLTVQAAVHGDRKAAFQALLAHPLGPEADQVQVVLEDLLNTNRRFLPQFFSE